ncbi:DUF6350 family protein [Microbacterium sediminis]|uniref:Uncharacterized protein n=1 Tax=Microbacterium sediminis TaxID=904291 RepID=A0A1B9N8E3_9MICO|nr:DUF6350 family protein [Microbacterium sediminis]OCG72871.1 hypothetical protein A7J15_10240 [Microbacterium sediminis]
MHRLLVALLAAVDAVVAAAVGIGAVLAPLTLLWIFTFGGTADWHALWPASARIWQLGNLVPSQLALDETYLRDAGLPDEAGAFAASVLLFAARSGRRAVAVGAWGTGVAAGVATTALLSLIVMLTSGNPVASVPGWAAVLAPTGLYAAGALGGVIAAAWDEGDTGPIDRLHDLVDRLPPSWRELPALAVRGAAIVILGLVAAGGALVALRAFTRGGDVIALFQAAQVDGLGAAALTLAHLAYLPTFIVWAISWIAGPGFALGAGATVSPVSSTVGLVPGIPVFGLVPESGHPLLLLAALVPVALGALAGWALRARMAGAREAGEEPVGPRALAAVGVAALSGAAAALLAAAASGSIGPGRLAHLGPEPGAVALAVGIEVLIGAGILLLGPVVGRPRPDRATDDGDAWLTADERAVAEREAD